MAHVNPEKEQGGPAGKATAALVNTDPGGAMLVADSSSVSPSVGSAVPSALVNQESMPLDQQPVGACPPWCSEPLGHGWVGRDGTTEEPIRLHTESIPTGSPELTLTIGQYEQRGVSTLEPPTLLLSGDFEATTATQVRELQAVLDRAAVALRERHPGDERSASGARPFWQYEPCPAWCRGGHAEHDRLEDRQHFNDAGEEITLSRHNASSMHLPVGGGVPVTAPSTVAVSLEQHVLHREAYVHLNAILDDSNVSYQLTVGEAAELAAQLQTAVVRAGGAA